MLKIRKKKKKVKREAGSRKGRWAGRYAESGLRVIALYSIKNRLCTCGNPECHSPAKHPRTAHGLKDATIDLDTIKGWWLEWPNANIGIRTGRRNNIVALDIDPRHGGDKSLAKLLKKHGELPPTVTAHTGGGGTHYVFEWPGEKISNRSNVLRGIDVRGDNGYIVAPPSNHASGNRYAWVEGLGPQDLKPAEMPKWLLELIREPSSPVGKIMPSQEHNGEAFLLFQRAKRYAEKVSGAKDGDRNNSTFRLAGHLFAFKTPGGLRLSFDDVLSLMSDWNLRNEPPLAHGELKKTVRSAQRNGESREDHVVDCVGKKRLRAPIPPWQPFPTHALPKPLRRFCRRVAVATQCDESFVALPLLTGLASAIGNSRTIRLTRTWREPAILWTCIVGESGTMKSPAIELALKPIRERQIRAMKAYSEDLDRYRDGSLIYERDLAAWKRTKDDEDPPTKPEQPTADRCWTDDCTIEALVVLLEQNPRGLLVAKDELAGWLRGFDRYAQGKGGEVAKWLEMHGGRPVISDRKGSGSLYVRRAAVSVTGGIQPGALRRALGREHFEDGLAARLLLTMPPRRAKRWSERDVSEQTEDAVKDVFAGLFGLQPAHGDDGEPFPVAIPFSPRGKAAWVAFYGCHNAEQTDLVGALASAWSKLEGYAARIALVVHCVRCVAGDKTLRNPKAVDAQSVAAGVELVRWFGNEARRVYGQMAESPEDSRRRDLIEWIMRKGGSVTVRQVQRGPSQYRGDRDAAQAALDELVEAGYGEWCVSQKSAKGGRPMRCFQLFDTGDGDKTPLETRA